MRNQDTWRGLSFGIWRPQKFDSQIGVNRRICLQQDSKIRRQSRRTKRADVDGYGVEIAVIVPFYVSAGRASEVVSSGSLRHMAVNHSIMIELRRGMEVKRRQTEEKQKQ